MSAPWGPESQPIESLPAHRHDGSPENRVAVAAEPGRNGRNRSNRRVATVATDQSAHDRAQSD